MEEKQKVLLVHNFYQIGGGEHTVFENERRLLEENGHEVVVYTRSNNELKTSLLKKILLPFTAVFSLRTYREVRSVIRKENIRLVHCHNTFPLISPSVYYGAWKSGVPVVQTVHNFRLLCPGGLFFRDGRSCEECVAGGLGRALKYGCYRHSRIQTAVTAGMLYVHRRLGTWRRLRYIFLTEWNREKFRPLLGDQVEREFVKPNFEYMDLPDREEPRDYSRFVFAGRLEEAKGLRFLLDVWSGIPDRTLVIYGAGPLEDLVRERAASDPRIVYRGFCPRQEVFADIRRSGAFLFSSTCYEGFPMTLVETMALGRPAVCRDIGNGAALVKEAGAGLCYGSAEEFIRCLDRICDPDRNRRLGENGRRAYDRRYTPQANYRMLKNIYDRVCAEYGQ